VGGSKATGRSELFLLITTGIPVLFGSGLLPAHRLCADRPKELTFTSLFTSLHNHFRAFRKD